MGYFESDGTTFLWQGAFHTPVKTFKASFVSISKTNPSHRMSALKMALSTSGVRSIYLRATCTLFLVSNLPSTRWPPNLTKVSPTPPSGRRRLYHTELKCRIQDTGDKPEQHCVSILAVDLGQRAPCYYHTYECNRHHICGPDFLVIFDFNHLSEFHLVQCGVQCHRWIEQRQS